MRRKLIAANWKMYKTPEGAREFAAAFLPLVKNVHHAEIVVCPPFVCLPAMVEALHGTQIGVGGQNMLWENEGAYTGEVSPTMLRAVGCTHVIIGHSERRQYFGETDDMVNAKLRVALEVGLTPIVCVGEVLEEREAGLTDDVLRRQCTRGLAKITAKKATTPVIAYEPVWAIGTGRTATPAMASEAHLLIRGEVAKALGYELANNTRILYGGSVKP